VPRGNTKKASTARHTQRPSPRLGRSREVVSQLSAIEAGGGEGEVVFDRRTKLHVSSLGKKFFPEVGVTKGGLMRYYAAIWPALKPHVLDRPLVLKRFPDGVGGSMFFQQNAGEHVPDVVRVEMLGTESEGKKPRIIGGDLATLLYTVQMGTIEVHPWLSRVGDIDHPDRCLIDLDPGDDVPFAKVTELARNIVHLAHECALPVAVKTSGSSGIHLVIPLPPRTSYDASVALASLLANAAVAQRPDLATVERSIRARPSGTIYVDAMQNARGKSMASAYSVRPKPNAPVSAPLTERELTARLRIDAYTVRTLPARVMRLGDVWGKALARRPSATTVRDALRALEQVLEAAPTEGSKPGRASRSRIAGGAGAGATQRQRRKRRT
jgi:bifunctional non-homologous end joining protein LigD